MRLLIRMASSQVSVLLCLLLSVSAMFLLLCYAPGLGSVEVWTQRRDNNENTGAASEEQGPAHEDQDSTEFPAEHLDPAAIDLTPLVNTLINSSQSGSSQLFSLLSVTSYSSMALHKLTLLVYNISSIKNIESSMLKRRFCYCVTNDTNDLTDFTAILLDVMGNSSSFLHELFKSSSILSVSQRNNSDCIYICVMAGQLGTEPLELWALDSITPLFNQTIVEGPHTARNTSAARPVPVPLGDWTPGSVNRSLMSPPVSRVHSTANVSPSSQALESEDPPAMAAVIPPATRTPLTSVPATSPKHSAAGNTSQPTLHQHPTAEVSLPVPSPASHPTADLSTDHSPPSVQASVFVPSSSPVSPQLSTSFSPQSGALAGDTSAVTPLQMLLTTQRTPAGGSMIHQPPTTASQTASTHLLKSTTILRGTTSPSRLIATEQPGCPWRRPDVSPVKLNTHKLQPCVFELCKFYSQCLCRSFRARRGEKRYCSESHVWYQKHSVEVCHRVRRLSFSRNLKQRCLSKMCDKL